MEVTFFFAAVKCFNGNIAIIGNFVLKVFDCIDLHARYQMHLRFTDWCMSDGTHIHTTVGMTSIRAVVKRQIFNVIISLGEYK